MMPSNEISPDGFDELTGGIRLTVEALARWRRHVLLLAVRAADEQRVALSGLVGWYERVYRDDAYHNSPPAEGVKALARLKQDVQEEDRAELAMVCWVLRAAEELARCRELLANTHNVDPRTPKEALHRLELALRCAYEANASCQVSGANQSIAQRMHKT